MQLRCPICKSGEFLAFNGRDNARCASCQAMERTRLLWLILEKHGLFRPGLRVMHVAPELPLAKRYSELLDERYFACDVDAGRYASSFTTIRAIDLCADLVKLPSRVFDLIIHSHVLEHLRCAPESVLGEFERLLAPGGHHFLSVPVSGEETREDLTDELSPAERSMLFGQADHFRIFGRRALPEMLDRVWGKSERHHIEPAELFGAEELESAAIPKEAWSGISSHSIFHHVRPRVRAVRIAKGAPASAPRDLPAVAPAVRKRPKLILHIGMPKAGTTSLQRWLSANRNAALAAGLDPWPAAENHSELMFMAFADPGRIARGAMWFQQDVAPEPDPRALEAFDEFLGGLGERTGLVSAEVLWSFPGRDVKILADHLKARDIDTAVLCFVRPPAEFLATAAQQRLRSHLAIGDFGLDFQDKVLIRYRRLDAWLQNFGRDAVTVLPLAGNVVEQLRGVLGQFGIVPEADADAARNLNPSVSLLAAKALLAFNEARGEAKGGGKSSRRLRTLLQELKGAEFRLPESALKRTSALLRKEAHYLSENFAMADDWLLADAKGVDDALFFHWEHAEVVELLRALDAALARLEDTGSGGREQ
ncbi:MAG TPA: class I SAM-dependent methyltransferase [Rhizomicrobium sp.]|jgi:SAM-dependent methyltransferase|nr:class I SAM-dependent methyltransferase [Rhizomicrobium sp.]